MKTDGFYERQARIIALILLSAVGLLVGGCASATVRHNNTGNERFAKGAYDQALAEYRLAQLEDPNLPEPYYNAANSHNRKSALSAVVGLTAQALRTAGPDLAANIWYNMGNAFFDAKQWPEAVAGYQEALRLKPDDMDAKHNLELALLGLDEEQEEETTQNVEQDTPRQTPPPEDVAPTPTAARSEEESANQELLTPEPDVRTDIPDAMGREQAEHLLEALIGNGETLQERLRKIHQAPATQPEKDW